MIGLASTILISSAALDQDTTHRRRTTAGDTQTSLLADLRHATAFTERTANAVTIVVPDRTGDDRPDSIRYAWSGTAGDPLTYSVNGSTARTLVADVHQFGLTYQTETIVAPVVPEEGETSSGMLLFVSGGIDSGGWWPGGETVSTTSVEDERITLLEAWGYTVITIAASQGNDDFAAGLAASSAIYVSPDVDAADLADKVTGSSLGIVNECVGLIDGLGFASSTDEDEKKAIKEVDPVHYITETFESDEFDILTSDQTMTGLAGTLAPGLTTLGLRKGGGDPPGLVILYPGETLHDGGSAAGRRVFLPWGAPGASIANLNANGQTIMQRAVEWADGAGPNDPESFGYDTILASTRDHIRQVQIATKVTLDAPGTLVSITAHVGGAEKDLRYALYADSGGEPGALLVESAKSKSPTIPAWTTLDVPHTSLVAGDYWLALSFDNDDQGYRYETAGQSRVSNNKAAKDGYTNSWGTSIESSDHAISIYGTYQPD